MPYILAKQRDEDVVAAFKQYRDYLEANRAKFPSNAYDLATSDWWFNFNEHKCPHDAWLESVKVIENSEGERRQYRTVSIRIILLNAYHDGIIELFYPEVFSYALTANHAFQGHDDWRYDEFRVDESGRLIHEIEWAGYGSSNTWVIEANDIEFTFKPSEST